MAIRGRAEVFTFDHPADKNWLGGPLFIRLKKWGRGSENQIHMQRRQKRGLPAMMKALSDKAKGRRR